MLSLGDKNKQLADAYNITMRLVEMGKHFKRFDLQDVFYIFKIKLDPYCTIQQDTSKEPLYLVDDYVKTYTFVNLFASIVFMDNFTTFRSLSDLFIKDSCVDVLKKK